MSVHIEAPTDAQLACIASLCREQGWPPPAAVHSKTEASAIIGAIRASTYRPELYEPWAEAWAERIDAGAYEDRAVPNLADFEEVTRG